MPQFPYQACYVWVIRSLYTTSPFWNISYGLLEVVGIVIQKISATTGYFLPFINVSSNTNTQEFFVAFKHIWLIPYFLHILGITNKKRGAFVPPYGLVYYHPLYDRPLVRPNLYYVDSPRQTREVKAQATPMLTLKEVPN